MNKRLHLAMAATSVISQICDDTQPFIIRDAEDLAIPKVSFSSKSTPLFREPHRELKEFSIKGHKVMAYSKKDAITRLKHMKKK